MLLDCSHDDQHITELFLIIFDHFDFLLLMWENKFTYLPLQSRCDIRSETEYGSQKWVDDSYLPWKNKSKWMTSISKEKWPEL